MMTMRDVIATAYQAFNLRDIDRALQAMHPDVEWANGLEGGYVTKLFLPVRPKRHI